MHVYTDKLKADTEELLTLVKEITDCDYPELIQRTLNYNQCATEPIQMIYPSDYSCIRESEKQKKRKEQSKKRYDEQFKKIQDKKNRIYKLSYELRFEINPKSSFFDW